ncbi:CDP-diacylglycerol--serine O-phosphatidyltransferase [Candidatus Methylacidithermus pantelleriae]|uniref:CDP-diacylglycerol--serine O-phosphatidyltransferase n=1 Tax=Candidatus Methylacidithermus pantelleriae TaxID=2744239 RepID=A0A8J2BQM3_9BACT|nr:CDP-diacylglycerol--serine O-phosphatidyltransferase [Candidatus Methylacidithermus pantelleriae]
MKDARENQGEEQIYLLPNLLTAGNLVCGFLAILKILAGTLERDADAAGWIRTYESSVGFILLAFVFDVLDGRLARLGGKESAFGRELDSLADLISFGVAPALLVFEIVLYRFPHRLGWVIACAYLICGALRLARFNVHAARGVTTRSGDFTGLPIPAAAGLVSSLTLLLLHYYEKDRDFEQGWGKYALAALLLFLSIMMASRVRYPSFKGFGWHTQRPMARYAGIVAFLTLTILYYKWMLAVDFTAYLLYGFLRPFLSRSWRREIEEEESDEGVSLWEVSHPEDARQELEKRNGSPPLG